ncbi:MAG: hypothetical protein LBE04_05920 [Prevotellaceae bacterium]|nr:hypothetical protein [Prevotellaceae bacterium]
MRSSYGLHYVLQQVAGFVLLLNYDEINAKEALVRFDSLLDANAGNRANIRQNQ